MTLLFPLHQIKGKYCIWKQLNACEQSQIPLCRSQQKSKNNWIISSNNTNTKNTDINFIITSKKWVYKYINKCYG